MKRGSRLEPLARAVLRTQSDERLVSLAREGREQAFEEIVRRYRPGLVAFAAAYAPRDSAEDVVQDSLARSWAALQESDSEIQLKAWLYTIVRNRALNARRDSRPHEPLDEQIDGVRQPPEIVLANDEFDRMVVAIRALPAKQREALVRSAVEGHTLEQIATSFGSSAGAVGGLVFRARAAVRHGVGLIIPLPLVRAVLDVGPDGAAAGAGAGSAAAAAAATGGGSMLAKGGAVLAAAALAAGGGVAIKHATGGADKGASAVEVAEAKERSSGERGSAGNRETEETGADQRAGEQSGHERNTGEGSGERGDSGGGGDSSGGAGGESGGSGGGSSGGSGGGGPSGGGSGGDSSGGGGNSSSGDDSNDDAGESSFESEEDSSGHGGGDDFEEVEVEDASGNDEPEDEEPIEPEDNSGSDSSGHGSDGESDDPPEIDD